MVTVSDEQYYYILENMVLSCCPFIRKIFKSRWKTEVGDNWVDDADHWNGLVELSGKVVSLKSLQGKTIEVWDVTLLSVAIKNLLKEKISNKYKDENSVVDELRKIRNDLAHPFSINKNIPEEEFNKRVEIVRTSLIFFGVKTEEINKLMERAKVTSSVKGLEFMNDWLKKAENLSQDNQPDIIKECFYEAINAPSLLPGNLATAYEKRAEYFLKLVKDPISDLESYSFTKQDIDKALELNASSWMAHYLAAKYHRMVYNFSLAIHHYQQALNISPAQTQVKTDLDTCKIFDGMYFPSGQMTPSKRDQACEAETVKGQSHVLNGHKYFCGWNVNQNFTEALTHYSKAAISKNTEGMYSLAYCYHHGLGAKKNIQDALEGYKKIAGMDGNSVGVGDAQFSLGLMYETGDGVKLNFIEAAKWYQKAMENGAGNAANNLAILFATGKMTDKNRTMAEMCWRKAVELKDCNAAASLVSYYLKENEHDKALEMVRIGRSMGSWTLINLLDKELKRAMDHMT